jgi:hypothetical protein
MSFLATQHDSRATTASDFQSAMRVPPYQPVSAQAEAVHRVFTTTLATGAESNAIAAC